VLINIPNAISRFYPNPSFRQIYFESVANAIDAHASEISILVQIDSFERVETLTITITDNGDGFTERNFEKFCRLLEVDNGEHKGLGRLVYLAYFKKVEINSHFGNKSRQFVFDAKFSGKHQVSPQRSSNTSTRLIFRNFTNVKLNSYDNLRPMNIKADILEQFLLILFQKKAAEQQFQITIELQTNNPNPQYNFYSDTQILTLDDVPEFKHVVYDKPIELFDQLEIFYNITKDATLRARSINTAILVDGRLLQFDLIPIESIPQWYQVRIFFVSDYFKGKTDDSRQKLSLPNSSDEKTLRRICRQAVAPIIESEIPTILEENTKTKIQLDKQFPHLVGYFPEDNAGLIIRNEVIQEAQQQFFADQRATLECTHFDDETYQKAVEVSARVLLEYILYRTRIIAKLTSITSENSEGEIHDLFVPRKLILKKDRLASDIFNNNVWMLDDKYMSYTTILSDADMTRVLEQIADDVEAKSEGRPDLTLVFSANPDTHEKVDLVVVELKKRGLALAKNEEVLSQLKQRARRLFQYYATRLERIWFYGISDIDDEFERSLKEDEFIELFSHGKMFYKLQKIFPFGKTNEVYVDMYIMTYDTFITDARVRNETFLNILKDNIRASVSTEKGGI
jgi:hypothetical protein